MNPPKRGGARTAKGIFDAWEKRTEMVKLQVNAESAANDAKTARLKALRLEKERQEAIEAAANPPRPVRLKKVRPASKRIIGS